MKRAAAFLIALLVHALTLAFIVLGARTIVVNAEFVFGWLIGGMLIGIGWLLRPRLARVPADAEVLGREDAAELYATAGRVASRMGVRPPDLVAVRDLEIGTSYRRVGLRRTPVLLVGLPVWLALSPRQRVTLLATAYAGEATGDDLVVGGALSTLGEWRQALLGSAPLTAREEARDKFTGTLGALHTPDTSYEVAGWIGRVIGRVLGAPVLLVEYALTRLARSGDGRARERRLALAAKAVTPEEVAELEELIAAGGYLAPMQAAALRGETVPAIRRDALARADRPGPARSPLLGEMESGRIDEELLAHYTRAVRGFGLIA
ncbi:M48 family metallopeptidase [Nonomuraea ferruginea]|uniref:M48 family metallopeptidase n=1 Tax=Nonomuraea ferruginea TaxID=46174 RepID=A0ABT4T5V4_9ACTN|nr:M48 family metallopeptidase [Nonomuraea ferruginea]MDA0644538.1 M48 family metallopeptidase [Nonomuraea ferruginea]